jgi:hypothetical protein
VIFISASQINDYRECPRRWGWKRIARIEDKQKVSALLGTEVDDEQIQPYLRDGRPFDYSKPALVNERGVPLTPSGYVAASMLPFLPQPKTVGIQHHFQIPSPTWITVDGKREHVGFGFQGYADLWADDSIKLPGCVGGVPGIGDTKTSTDIGKWAKTEKDLLTDVQAMLYALACMFETGARTVDLDWIYGQTRGTRKAKQVVVRVHTEHVEEQFEAINVTALEMFGIRQIADVVEDKRSAVLALDPDPDSCGAFGGCPYQSECNLSPQQLQQAFAAKAARLGTRKLPVIPGTEGEITMGTQDMLAALRAKKAAQAGQSGATASSVPAPAATLPAAAAAVAAPAPPSSPPVQQVTSPETGLPAALPAWATETKPFTGYANGAAPLGINPPESTLPPAPPLGVTSVPATEAPKRTRRTKAEMEAARAAAGSVVPIPDVDPGVTLEAIETVVERAVRRVFAQLGGGE